MDDAELIARLRGWVKDIQEGSEAIWAMDQDLKEAADRIEALVAERDAARDAALEEAAKAAKELLEDEGTDLQAISDGYVDALSSGVHGGRKIPRDFAKTCADRFKERSDAVYQMGGHVAAAIRALTPPADLAQRVKE